MGAFCGVKFNAKSDIWVPLSGKVWRVAVRFLHQHQTPRHVLPHLFYLALPLLGARYYLLMLGLVASSKE